MKSVDPVAETAIHIAVKGMTCEHCASKVRTEIASVPGVDDVAVNLDSGYVDVAGSANPAEIIEAIRRAGYEADDSHDTASKRLGPPETASVDSPEDAHAIQLNIGGMSCASCVARVESSLAAVAGVSRANVNYADQSAYVVGSVDEGELIRAVEDAGYRASIRDESASGDRDEELNRNLRIAFTKSGVALAIGVVLMAGMQFGIMPSLNETPFWTITGLAILAVMLVTGGHFFKGALSAARHLTTTMDTLIALGTGTAWVYSMLIVLVPQIFPLEARHVFFEAAVFIIGFINLGKALEDNAKGKTSLAVRKLIDLAPKTAVRIEGDEEVEVPLSVVEVGDLLRIRPGETVPVDGIIEQGDSTIDESAMTGESIPQEKSQGDNLLGGTINLYGAVVMKATQVGADTVLAKMIGLVREAQNSKPAIGRLTDRIASVFVPIVILIAILTAVVWWMVGPEPRISYVVVTAMSVLIIACPCALGLAIPMSIMVGMGRAAGEGVLIKNGEALQAASRLTTIVLDKTGTLTRGRPEVTRVEALADESDMLKVAYNLERQSEHPLARAVVDYCKERSVDRMEVEEFDSSPGGGVKASINGDQCAVGNAKWLEKCGIGMPQDLTIPDASTVIYVGRGEELLGYFELFDELKDDAVEHVAELRALGLKIVMLTGDNEASARRIAGELSLDGFVANVQPEDKLAEVKRLQAAGERVGMVGDGINDSLALSAADVGFAMGEGTDIAIESADVALLSDDVGGVLRSILLSRAIMRNIYQNLVGAFSYNVLLIPVAAGALFPLMGLLINPAFAGLAMAASSVTVVANASRLRWISVNAPG